MNDYEQLQTYAAYINRRDTDNMLRELWASTRDLHNRFGIRPTTPEQYELIREEMREVINASQTNMGEHVAHEAADCIVVLLGLLMAHGLTLHDLEHAMRAVIVKNDSKTHETHAVDSVTHKIKRLVDPSRYSQMAMEWMGEGD